MAELPIERDFVQVKYAHRIRRLARERFGRECVWVQFETTFYKRRLLLERLAIAAPDGSIDWVADCLMTGMVSWVRPADGVRYEIQAPRGEVSGWENGGRL